MDIYFTKKISDEKMKTLDGSYIDSNYYDTIIDYDCDGYWKDDKNELHFIFSFRKKKIPSELSLLALNAFRKFSMTKKENRGSAAGNVCLDKLPKYVSKIDTNRTMKNRVFFYKKNGELSKQTVSNISPSNIAGFFDYPYAHSTIKRCKESLFLTKYPDKWLSVLPYIKCINDLYKNICPFLYKTQLEKASNIKDYIIKDTVFSTITMNYSWRSAIHLDKHNLKYKHGAAILTIVEDNLNPNEYSGCYLGYPQFGFAIDVREGDILITNNQSGWHGNTEFYPIHKTIYYQKPEFKPSKRFRWKEQDIKHQWYFNRLSMVFYLREGLQHCF